MNVNRLLKKYFALDGISTIIETFDKDSIYNVYTDIIKLLNAYPDIELGVLQALSYCFYEILDNVLTHSEKVCGTVMMRFIGKDSIIQILVADDGIGIHRSLSANPIYEAITEKEAVVSCINDRVTDGKGMGFGLYSTARLVKNAGIMLNIHSGNSIMSYDGNNVTVTEDDYWQGTLIYFELHSNKDINPNDVVDDRTDCAEEFNDLFIDTEELENLW